MDLVNAQNPIQRRAARCRNIDVGADIWADRAIAQGVAVSDYLSVVWMRLICKKWNLKVLDAMTYLYLSASDINPRALWRDLSIKLHQQPRARFLTFENDIPDVQLDLEDQTLPEDRLQWSHEYQDAYNCHETLFNDSHPMKYILTMLRSGWWAHSAETLDLILCKPPSDQFSDEKTDVRTFFNTASAFFHRGHSEYTGVALPEASRGQGPIAVLEKMYKVQKCTVGPLSLRVERLFTAGDDFMEGSKWFEQLQGLFDDLFNAKVDEHLAAGLALGCNRDGLRWSSQDLEESPVVQ